MIVSNPYLGSMESKCPEKDLYDDCNAGLKFCHDPKNDDVCEMSCCIERETAGT